MSNTKSLKTKGPIRWSGFAPLLLFFGAVVLYFLLLFDTHLKWTFEWTGSKLNGAQVEISSLKTSFLKGDFRMAGIQVASPKEAMKNRFEVGQVHFQFLLRPLLALKFVVEDASIKNVRYGTDREKPGLLPQSTAEPSKPLMQRYFPGMYDSMKAKFEGNPLENLGTLYSSFDIDGELSKAEKNLKAPQAIRDARQQVQHTERAVTQKARALPNESDLQGFQRRLQELQCRKPKQAHEYVAVIGDAQKLKGDIDAKLKSVESLRKEINSSTTNLNKKVSSIDGIIEKDVQGVGKNIKLPSFDFKDITGQLFGDSFLTNIERVAYWIAWARRKMPKGEKKDGLTTVKAERAHGTDIRWGRDGSYPKFVLKNASLESDISKNSAEGTVTGTIAHLISDPAIYGVPTEIKLEGDFPKSHIYGGRLSLMIDHTGDKETEVLSLSANNYPVQDFLLNKSDDLNFAIQSAKGQVGFSAVFLENRMNASLQAKLSEVRYLTESNHRELEETLTSILKAIPRFQVLATLKGPFDNLSLTAKSDFGEKLAAGFKREFQGRIAQLEKRIRQSVVSRVSKEKQALNREFKSFQNRVEKPVQARLAQLKKVENDVNNAKRRFEEQQKKAAQQSAQKKAQEELKKVVPKIKF